MGRNNIGRYKHGLTDGYTGAVVSTFASALGTRRKLSNTKINSRLSSYQMRPATRPNLSVHNSHRLASFASLTKHDDTDGYCRQICRSIRTTICIDSNDMDLATRRMCIHNEFSLEKYWIYWICTHDNYYN